ncbi:MAG TPA: FkbM family methyltransferase [Candidatus Kapabacteria bacterium]|nr:FkbM family methyltransferase [Candidatus Kapabacteria bacterium]
MNSLPKNQINEEQQKVLSYLKRNLISVFPYSFTKKYKSNKFEIYKDKSNSLNYVVQDGKRLYFKRDFDEKSIRRCYPVLQIEQDIESPHRYLTEDFDVDLGDIVLDIGAAEGNFSLSIVEKVEKIFLFEADAMWLDALESTFSPWKSKIEIINKFVSNFDDDNNFTLDNFFKSNKKIDFIKMDVEGAELDVLKGSKNILEKENQIKLAVSTYHRQNDAKEINELLKRNNFTTEFSNGYMIFYYDKLEAPYLRKALIRAKKG